MFRLKLSGVYLIDRVDREIGFENISDKVALSINFGMGLGKRKPWTVNIGPNGWLALRNNGEVHTFSITIQMIDYKPWLTTINNETT